MISNNLDIEIIEFIDLVNITLSSSFVDKWRHKYSVKFINHFQYRLLQSLDKRKPLKQEVLFNYLTKKCKYSTEQVDTFFEDIDISIYSPFISS